jgi:chemotaxis protein methyltransferase CheR
MSILPSSLRAVEGEAAAAGKDDYRIFCACLLELTGLDLSKYKRQQMERRLRTFYSARGIESLSEACLLLRNEPDALDAVLDRVTINVSQLWRNPEQWELIERELLPTLAASARADGLRAWSAGCSYGAEAYTLATLCRIICPSRHVAITGTDIDRRMVARARTGIFTEQDARTAPAGQLRHGFEQVDAGWRARPELRAMTHFEVGDLLRERPAPGSLDLILCRNTVIYFVEPIRDALHARMSAALRSGGYLVIGSTERVTDPGALGLVPTYPFIYRKA